MPMKQISSLYNAANLLISSLGTSLVIASPPLDTVRNLGVTFDRDFNFRKHVSLACHSYFYHIRELCRIRRYISISVTKSPRFSHSVLLLKSLHWLPVQSHTIFKLCTIAYQTFFWRTFISIFHAFFIIQAQRAPFIWFSLVVCSNG